MNKKQELLKKCKKIYQDYDKKWQANPELAKQEIDAMPFEYQMAIS